MESLRPGRVLDTIPASILYGESQASQGPRHHSSSGCICFTWTVAGRVLDHIPALAGSVLQIQPVGRQMGNPALGSSVPELLN